MLKISPKSDYTYWGEVSEDNKLIIYMHAMGNFPREGII